MFPVGRVGGESPLEIMIFSTGVRRRIRASAIERMEKRASITTCSFPVVK
jgi:hypothetical protein